MEHIWVPCDLSELKKPGWFPPSPPPGTSHGAIPFRRRLFQRLPRTTWRSWRTLKLPEIFGVEESFKIRRFLWVSEIHSEFESSHFGSTKTTQTHTDGHWWLLTVPSCPSSSFLCKIFIHCSSAHPKNKKNCRQKQQNLPMIFRFFSGSSTPASGESPVEKLPFGLIPGVWGDCGGFNRGYLAVTGVDSSCGLVSSSCGFNNN